jgi:hypothetical protein
MLLKLTKIPVIPLAGVVGLIQGSLGIILGAMVTIGSLFNQEAEGIWSLGVWAIVILPIVNVLLGFVTGALLALFYNTLGPLFNQAVELEFEQLDSVTLK